MKRKLERGIKVSVDANCIVAYGCFLNNVEIREDYSDDENNKVFFIDKEGVLCYNYDIADEKGFYIRVEPYSCAWTFIGIPFLKNTPEDTIEALKIVKEKWNELIKELKEAIPNGETYLPDIINKLEPKIVEEPYYS